MSSTGLSQSLKYPQPAVESCSLWEAGTDSATGLLLLPPNSQSGKDCGKGKKEEKKGEEGVMWL